MAAGKQAAEQLVSRYLIHFMDFSSVTEILNIMLIYAARQWDVVTS